MQLTVNRAFFFLFIKDTQQLMWSSTHNNKPAASSLSYQIIIIINFNLAAVSLLIMFTAHMLFTRLHPASSALPRLRETRNNNFFILECCSRWRTKEGRWWAAANEQTEPRRCSAALPGYHGIPVSERHLLHHLHADWIPITYGSQQLQASRFSEIEKSTCDA